MVGLIAALLGSMVAVGVLAFVGMRGRRLSVYRQLNEKIGLFKDEPPAVGTSFAVRFEPSDFSDRIGIVREFLPRELFEALKTEIAELAGERSFIPRHKQGGTVAYKRLIAHAPMMVRFYHSAEFQSFISQTVGDRVQPTPVWDQSSLLLLVYNRPGDHIGWHYDHNFFRGRHFTVLLVIRNEGTDPERLSHSRLTVNRGDKAATVPAPANSLVVFEGARVLHMVTPVRKNETRIVLSMTYCTDPRAFWWRELARRMKDTAFFGLRALWT